MKSRLAFIFLVTPLLVHGQTTGWKLFWSDEFSGNAGSAPDTAKWGYDTGGGGWGNNELETYTSSTANAFQDGQGHLVIQALSANGGYTSARLKTQSTFSFTYGKVEARIKMPYAQGIWPAFWMLGSNITTVSWPKCGEIDIMENFGVTANDAAINHGTIHGPNYSGAGVGANYTLPGGAKLADDFHIYGVAWGPGSVEFLVDGVSYFKATTASLPSGGTWVFDNNPMFLLLNMAVGGSPAPVGYPNATTTFPQQMLVDYVRVYQQTTVASGVPNITPNGVVDSALGSSNIAAGGLATVYGTDLADGTYPSTFDSRSGAFATSTPSGVSVTVNGVAAPLTYVSPQQINFEVPWASPVNGAPVSVTVARGQNVSYAEPVSLATAAPGVFQDYAAGTALVTGCSPKAGAACVMWGNGFGPVGTGLVDGVPAPLAANWVTGSCQLAIAGANAPVGYCGSAPGLVIDQLNFTYPPSVSGTGAKVSAVLTVNGASTNLMLPVSR